MRGLTVFLLLGIFLNEAIRITATATCPEGLPEDPQDDILLPHEYDCTKFYKCSFGEKILQKCPVGLHFNSNINQCDWPQNAECEKAGNTSDEIGTNLDEGVVVPENGCPSESNPLVNILLPHESDCTKFYQCSNGQKVLYDCPSDLYFNSKTNRCDWPVNVNCTNNSIESNHTKTNKNEGYTETECASDDPLANILLPHESDCTKFYQCANGAKVLHNCTLGLHFNPKTYRCEWPEEANCENGISNGGSDKDINDENSGNVNNDNESDEGQKTDVPNNECPAEDPPTDVLFPHEYNCSQFYKCSHGQKVLQNCPSGLYFNTETRECDWPENTNCTMGIKYLPHENDCRKFYQLVKGAKFEYSCTDGFHFSPEQQACDHQSNVKCENKNIKEWSGSYLLQSLDENDFRKLLK